MQEKLLRAIELFNNKQYDSSFSIFNDLLQSDNLDILQESYKYIGLISMNMSFYYEAIDFFNTGLELSNSFDNEVTFEFNIGISYYKLEKYEKALKYFENVYFKSENLDVLLNIADCNFQLSKYEKAVIYYDEVLEYDCKNIYAQINKGLAFKHLGEYHKALSSYDLALEIDIKNKDALWNRSLVLLLQGEYELGLRDFENRFYVSNSQFNIEVIRKFKKYNNEGLNGRNFLIVPEQGFGDNIQMIRYLELFKNFDTKIFVLVLKEQKKLFKNIDNINIVNIFDQSWHKKIDFYIPLLSLPFVFQTKLGTIPANIPYLKVKKNKSSIIRKSGKFNIGFVWQGEKNHQNDINRSIPIKIFKKLFNLKDIDFYSLQLGENANKIFSEFDNVYDCSEKIDNFYDTAQIINEMDLVISIDSAVAHLSGALGKRTWILLPFVADWRWMINRNDSPWYPTAKLFRVEKEREWKPLLKKVKYELKLLHTQYD